MFDIEKRGFEQLELKLTRMSDRIRAELEKAMLRSMINLSGHVKQNKLSGQVLNVRTGTLRRSVTHKVTGSKSGVVGIVGTNVKYAAIHEFGGRTAAHDIFPKRAKALHFKIGGKDVFAKRVRHRGSTMPERSFLRSGLRDKADSIMADLRAAVARGVHS